MERDYTTLKEQDSPYTRKITFTRTARDGCGRSHDPSHAPTVESSDDSSENDEEGEEGGIEKEEYHMLVRMWGGGGWSRGGSVHHRYCMNL